ncbi:MAG: DoxX family protein [Rhodanobacteraceae bacterium]|nr:MAG: DoxX family protein [Rhodanobacteraceae bacterium]
MRYTLLDGWRDEVLLVARILLVILYVLFGYQKLAGFHDTIGEMVAVGLPIPTVAAVVVVILEFFVGIAILFGFFTRPLALLLAVYTLATGFIGHHYWTMTGDAHVANMINFYKNVSIMGGFVLLALTGPGKYSIDRK